MEREVDDRVVAMEAVVASSKDGGVQGRRSGRPVGAASRSLYGCSQSPLPYGSTSGAGLPLHQLAHPLWSVILVSEIWTTEQPKGPAPFLSAGALLPYLPPPSGLKPPYDLHLLYGIPQPMCPGWQVTFILQRGVAAGPPQIVLHIFSLTGDLAG